MPRVCTICTHPKRLDIEKASIARETIRAIASRFGVDKQAVLRHRWDHITARLAAAASVKEQLETDDLLGQARTIQGQALGLLSQAMAVDAEGKMLTPELGLRALREARDGVRLLGEVLGKLQPSGSPTVNVGVGVGFVTVIELPSNGREQGAREAALEQLRAMGQLPPILIRAVPPLSETNGDGRSGSNGTP